MRITVFQNHDSNDQIRPVWLAIDFGMDGVPWTQKSLYLDVSSFDISDMYNFMDDIIGCTVYLEELLADPEGKLLGMNLERIYARIRTTGLDPALVERFIIQVCDAQEVLTIGEEMFR